MARRLERVAFAFLAATTAFLIGAPFVHALEGAVPAFAGADEAPFTASNAFVMSAVDESEALSGMVDTPSSSAEGSDVVAQGDSPTADAAVAEEASGGGSLIRRGAGR